MGCCQLKYKLCQNVDTRCCFSLGEFDISTFDPKIHGKSMNFWSDSWRSDKIFQDSYKNTCNGMQLNPIPGWVLHTYGIKQTSIGWYCWISKHKSVLSHTNHQVCDHNLLKLKGKDCLGLLADGWAVPWEGKRYEFERCQTKEEIDTSPQFNNTLERLLKSSHCRCLSCGVDALHGAAFSLIPWMSMPSFWIYCGLKVLSKGTLLKTSLQPAIRVQLHVSGFQ